MSRKRRVKYEILTAKTIFQLNCIEKRRIKDFKKILQETEEKFGFVETERERQKVEETLYRKWREKNRKCDADEMKVVEKFFKKLEKWMKL